MVITRPRDTLLLPRWDKWLIDTYWLISCWALFFHIWLTSWLVSCTSVHVLIAITTAINILELSVCLSSFPSRVEGVCYGKKWKRRRVKNEIHVWARNLIYFRIGHVNLWRRHVCTPSPSSATKMLHIPTPGELQSLGSVWYVASLCRLPWI